MGFQVFKKPAFRYAMSGFVTAVAAFGVYSVGVPVANEFATSFAMKEFKQYGVAGTYKKHFFSFVDRFHGLAQLESDNETLRSQLAKLEAKKTVEEAGIAERELASMNEVLEKKTKEQSGSEEAHLPQTLGYEVPMHLMPSELYPLGLAYFRKQEFEKAVAIFDHLFKLPEDRRYETSENFLISGISWYYLKNYVFARKHVEEAIAHSHANDPVHRQAMLWEALIEKADGRTQVAQTKLLHFIGEYAHSEEGAWINGSAPPKREPANAEEGDAKTEAHETAEKPAEGKTEDHGSVKPVDADEENSEAKHAE